MSSVRERMERAQGIVTAPATPAPAAPVQEFVEQDPSMPGRPVVAAPAAAQPPVVPAAVPVTAPEAAAPVVPAEPVAPAAPAEIPEQRYSWQPKDEAGRPMGGVQVYKYRAPQPLPDSILEQLVKPTELLMRQLRKERREKALGITEEVNDAEKFQNVVEFKPRELSADERFKLAQGLVDPEKFVDARDSLIESVFGAKPSVLASTLNETQRFLIQQRAVQNYVEFVNATGFNDTLENRTLITGWLGTRNLAPTAANFAIAQKRLIEAGLLQETPVVHQAPVVTPAEATPAPAAPVVEESKPQVPPVTPPVLAAVPEVQAKRHSHVPSGLTPSVASTAGVDTPVGGTSLTLADIDKLSADEYKRRAKDPAFLKLVNDLEVAAAARRRARAQGQ